ncbi:hypothetical protein RJT34_18300 [Clitoria ternatea]|uniref:Uncharacterized protein n=1 Tax=Clitoria ternatea TaxID=43366 RepID=A0AAN9JCS1_CLITE
MALILCQISISNKGSTLQIHYNCFYTEYIRPRQSTLFPNPKTKHPFVSLSKPRISKLFKSYSLPHLTLFLVSPASSVALRRLTPRLRRALVWRERRLRWRLHNLQHDHHVHGEAPYFASFFETPQTINH